MRQKTNRVVRARPAQSPVVSLRSVSRGAVLTSVAAAVAGILYCSGAYAADETSTEAAKSDTATLDEVVVTANASVGLKKLDASYNIISADAEAIKNFNPKSTADLLKLSPGIWPESSGGQTGANIEIAGIPGGGDAPFFTNMIEGSPMYGMPSLSFMDSSSFVRLDDTVERVEVVQGGPGAVLGPGQMGATANFILKRGTATPTGSIALTYGSEGSERVDGFYGGPIAEGWYGSVGGFYRRSDGVRSPQFEADDGGQFTATVSHDLDNGSFMLWARVLDDKNQFIVPVPLIENANGSFSDYPGFNALTSAYGSKAMQYVTLPSPAGGFENANLANGRGADMKFFGAKYDNKFGDWTVGDSFMFDGGNLNTNALFSGPNPRPLSYYLYGCAVTQPAGFCNGATALDKNNLGTGGQGLPTSTNVNANYVTGGAVAPNQSVITQGWWFIQKQLQNITNDFRLSRLIFDGNTLTAGLYLAHYTDDDNWSLGNTMLMSNTPNATPITLNYLQGGNTYNLTSPQGFVNFNGNTNLLDHGDATNIAPYLSDSWKLNSWLFDVSARAENLDAHQRTCNTTKQQLGTVYDLYENAVPICNGTFDDEHYDKTQGSYTAGANYEIASNMSVYGRVNNGSHFDDFDNNIRDAKGKFSPVEKLKNYEVGFKYQSTIAYLDVSAYHKQFTGLQYQETNAAGIGAGPVSNYGSNATGVDFIGTLTPIEHLNLTVVGDYMNGHYTHYDGCAPYIDINGNSQCAKIDGAPLQRQPKVQLRFTPSYTLVPTWGDVTGSVTYEHVGQRYEDITGLQPLGAYYMLGAGVVANIGTNWQLRLQGTNLTNQIGLTEGNARKTGAEAGVNGVILARPIEGREGSIQVKYKF
jgi:outer membrane receptor protein involved in Fe transport